MALLLLLLLLLLLRPRVTMVVAVPAKGEAMIEVERGGAVAGRLAGQRVASQPPSICADRQSGSFCW